MEFAIEYILIPLIKIALILAIVPGYVAVITPHVEQASAIGARLADLPGALIGTANQAQGLEREAGCFVPPLLQIEDT